MRRLLPILALTALATPASALCHHGYVPATIFGRLPGEAHSIRLCIPRKFCGLTIPAFTEDDEQPASAGAICR